MELWRLRKLEEVFFKKPKWYREDNQGMTVHWNLTVWDTQWKYQSLGLKQRGGSPSLHNACLNWGTRHHRMFERPKVWMGLSKELVKPVPNRHMWEMGCELWLRKCLRQRVLAAKAVQWNMRRAAFHFPFLFWLFMASHLINSRL